MPKLQLTGRTAALVGVGAAVSTAALVAFAAPAIAADSNKTTSCTDQVRVRADASSTSKVIGSCKAGEKVTTDESKNGFTHLVSKKGWVSDQYLKDAGSSSSDSRNGRNDSSDSEGSSDNGPDSADSDHNDDGDNHDGDSRDGDNDNHDDNDDGGSSDSGGGLGGIL